MGKDPDRSRAPGRASRSRKPNPPSPPFPMREKPRPPTPPDPSPPARRHPDQSSITSPQTSAAIANSARRKAPPAVVFLGPACQNENLSSTPPSSPPSTQDLLRRDALLRQAEKLANFGAWEYEVATDRMYCSENFFRILGLAPKPNPVSIDDFANAANPGKPGTMRARVQSIIAGRKPVYFVFSETDATGATRVRHTAVELIFDHDGNVERLIGTTQDITDLKNTENELRKLSYRLLTLRNDEQRRMARNLHETASQTLAVLRMTLGRISGLFPHPGTDLVTYLAAARKLADDALREVRGVSALLYPPLLEEAGLVSALKNHARTLSERIGVSIRVDIPSELPRLLPDVEVTIFRVVQEALTNVHRHAKASSVLILLKQTEDSVQLAFSDDGIGMDVPKDFHSANVHLGVGLAAMRDRVRLLGGSFAIASAPNQGTTLRVDLPLTEEAQAALRLWQEERA